MILDLGEGVGTISVREILEVGVWAILVLVIVEKKTLDLVEKYYF